jgi:peptidoglycan/LPS O-acetylase OafA/YrhL
MSQRVTRTDLRRNKRKSRLITLAWIVSLAVVVIILLSKEKADWLYVLATLGVTVLLIVVAFADLHGGRKGVEEADLGDDAAALGNSIPATTQPAAVASSDWGRTKKLRK